MIFEHDPILRKLTYLTESRRFAQNWVPDQKGRIWPQMELCNYLKRKKDMQAKEFILHILPLRDPAYPVFLPRLWAV